jgi:hypothetical protein
MTLFPYQIPVVKDSKPGLHNLLGRWRILVYTFGFLGYPQSINTPDTGEGEMSTLAKAMLPQSWGINVPTEGRGSGLKLTTQASAYLAQLKRTTYVPKATAASNLVLWMRDLKEPKAIDLMILNLTDCPRKREATRAVIRAMAREHLPGETVEFKESDE